MDFSQPGGIALLPYLKQENRQTKRQQSNDPRECEQNFYADRNRLEEDQQVSYR